MPRQRFGFTLIEMLVVIGVVGIMVAVALPKAKTIRNAANVRAAKDALGTSIATARAAAVQKGYTARFRIQGDSMAVMADTNASGASMTVMPRRNLNQLYGVTVSVVPQQDTVLPFDARGFSQTASGAVSVYVITLGTLRDSVCVARFGLLLKNGCAI
jgi:prepilin-type N-terminal cleavage/methylation domain-containing protein